MISCFELLVAGLEGEALFHGLRGHLTWIPFIISRGYLNSLVFETPVEMDMELVARIVAAYDTIQNTSGKFVRVRQNLVRRCHVCIEVGGRQFEQLL